MSGDEAFQQKFAGAALGVIWSVIAGFIILNLDGVWRVMAIAAFFAMGTTTIIMIARAGGCGHYAVGLALSLVVATLIYWNSSDSSRNWAIANLNSIKQSSS